MKLEFDELDLKPQHKTVQIRFLGFRHLKLRAKLAVILCGTGTYYNWQRDCYNRIYSPLTRFTGITWPKLKTKLESRFARSHS